MPLKLFAIALISASFELALFIVQPKNSGIEYILLCSIAGGLITSLALSKSKRSLREYGKHSIASTVIFGLILGLLASLMLHDNQASWDRLFLVFSIGPSVLYFFGLIIGFFAYLAGRMLIQESKSSIY